MCKILSILNVKISFHSPSTFKLKMNVQNSFHSHSSFYFTNVNVNVQNSFHLPYDPNSWWCNVNVNVNVKKTLPKLILARSFGLYRCLSYVQLLFSVLGTKFTDINQSLLPCFEIGITLVNHCVKSFLKQFDI